MLSISLKIKRKCINATVSQNVINYSQTFVFFLFCFWRLKNVLFRNVAIIFYKGFHLFAFHIKYSVKWEKKKKKQQENVLLLAVKFPFIWKLSSVSVFFLAFAIPVVQFEVGCFFLPYYMVDTMHFWLQ